jgi:hypothetical protein
MVAVYVIVALLVVVVFVLAMSVRIIKQYERVVLFELGKVKGEARGPGGGSDRVFPAPLMSTIAELGAFLGRETAAAAALPAPPNGATNGEVAAP